MYNITLDYTEQTILCVVGCGGTGSIVAEGLCRLLIKSNLTILLVDHDRVEPHNLLRQNFFAEDVGRFKSQALAERLARQYGRRIGYYVTPYDGDMFDERMGMGMTSRSMHLIIIGCVDNVLARREIARSMGNPVLNKWWLDSGNGHHSGQVLLGNVKSAEAMQESFYLDEHIVSKLPMPSLQLPALLIPPSEPERQNTDCAEAIAEDDQSPVINQAMATLVLEFMYRLLSGTLTTMGAYLDLETGNLTYVPAEPVTVARMLGIKVDSLMANTCALGARYHI